MKSVYRDGKDGRVVMRSLPAPWLGLVMFQKTPGSGPWRLA